MVILRSEMVPDTLFGVPEMMDTPPIQNYYAFLFCQFNTKVTAISPARLAVTLLLLPIHELRINRIHLHHILIIRIDNLTALTDLLCLSADLAELRLCQFTVLFL